MNKKFGETKVGQFLAKYAPGVLDAVGDIFPPAKILSALFNTTPDVLPEQRLEFERLVKDYELNELKEYLADVQNARNMQIAALNQSDTFSKRFIYYLGAGSALLGFIYIYLVTFIAIPANSLRIADTILGVVIGTVFGTIFNFFFGSSKGSSDKNELIKNITSS